MATLKISKVIKRFGKLQTIHGVSLDVKHGEFVVFVGPSGCGKSTLLRMIAGLESITEGDIYIDSVNVKTLSPAERGIAMVFQSYALFPHMTVRENMGFGLRMARQPKPVIETQVNEAARILQLEPLLDRKPKELSGGQRQRVAIGRAIVRHPKVFLFDEPLSNLDAELRLQMRVELARLHSQLDATMVYVTHDQVEAMTLADKIVVLRDGRIEQVGSPLELYHCPVNRFVAGFIGSPKMNFMPAQLCTTGLNDVEIKLADDTRFSAQVASGQAVKGDRVTVGIRPEHLEEGEDLPYVIQGRVTLVERLGETSYIYLTLADGTEIIVRGSGTSGARSGELIKVCFDPQNAHVFSEDGEAFDRVLSGACAAHVESARSGISEPSAVDASA